jgi:hypothetical protein
LSGLNFDLILCHIHGIFSPFSFISLMKFSGLIHIFTLSKKYFHAQSIAHQNLGQIVVNHDIKLDFKSFQARAVTIALVAQETAGP